MAAALVLTVLQDRSDAFGHLAALAVGDHGDEVVVATVGAAGAAVLASPDARAFVRRTWRGGVIRDVLATADAVWACGDGGELAVSRDRGATWSRLDTGATAALRALARASDGAVWAVGDGGFAARVGGDARAAARVDLGTTAALTAVYAVGDDIVALGGDG